MSFQEIINQMGIELLVFGVCLYFGLKLIITRDVTILKRDDPETIKHPGEYAFYGGLLMLFLGTAALVMGIISFFNAVAAFIFMIVAFIIMGIIWKFMHEKFA